MAKKNLYYVYDTLKGSAAGDVITEDNHKTAWRQFRASQAKVFDPESFQLFFLASFDTETGKIIDEPGQFFINQEFMDTLESKDMDMEGVE